MKTLPNRLCLTALLLCALMLLSACGSPASGAKSTRELAERYLSAIINEEYEAVLSLLPDQIVEYGMNYLEGSRDDVVDFVRYAAYDYSWLSRLPAHVEYTFEMTETPAALPGSGVKGATLLEEDGVRLYVQDAVILELSISTGAEEPCAGSLFALKIDGRWYLSSVAGDDELFKY